jgi:RNA polymerase sigma-54 factor
VREGLGGMWHVDLNADTLPRVLVDQRYHAQVSGKGARSDQEKTFVSDCFASANWLVKSLDQRAKTILKVASEIVRQQDGFLAYRRRAPAAAEPQDRRRRHRHARKHGQPGYLEQVCFATPRGVFELKFFFTAAIQSSEGGEAHSAASVRTRSSRPGRGREAREPTSTRTTRSSRSSRTAGVDIARRTVAKYREALRIPSSVERRRLIKETC